MREKREQMKNGRGQVIRSRELSSRVERRVGKDMR